MRRITSWIKIWWLCVCCLLPMELLAQNETLQIGVLPTLSPRALLKNYELIRGHLAKELRQPVALGTAPDFPAFHRQALEGNFDIVVTAAHLARLLQREAGWIPLADYITPNQAILIVSKNGSVKTVEDLRGKTISSADPVAMLLIQTQLWLQEQGLQMGRDYQFLQTPSFTSAAYAVSQNQIALAVMSPSSFRQMPDNIKQDVKIFLTLPPIQGITWMAHPKHAQDIKRLKQALLSFSAETAEGREFFQVTGYKGLREMSNEPMRSMDPYADLVKPKLNNAR